MTEGYHFLRRKNQEKKIEHKNLKSKVPSLVSFMPIVIASKLDKTLRDVFVKPVRRNVPLILSFQASLLFFLEIVKIYAAVIFFLAESKLSY